MNFFRLKVDRRLNKEWRVILPPVEDKMLQLINIFNRGEKPIINRPINMGLINTNSEKSQRKEIPFNVDLLYWLDDFMLGTSVPDGAYIIVSSKLKKIIEKFNLPDHQFYRLNLYCTDYQEESQDYYLLYIFGNIHQFTNFPLSEYTYYYVYTDEVIKIETGGFKDADTFFKARTALSNQLENKLDKKRASIKITKRVFTEDYDVMWGVANHLTINERIKTVIDNANLNGVDLRPFKFYEIIPPIS